MKSEYIKAEALRVLINSMHYENSVALLISLETGLRIGDVLKIKRCDIKGNNIKYIAEKTGKKGNVTVSDDLLKKIRSIQGRVYIFPGQKSNSHRTRQAVYLDIKRVCKMYGVKGQISPHSARKSFAVDDFRENGLDAVKEHLQHSSTAVTMLYALADEIDKGKENIKIDEHQSFEKVFNVLMRIESKTDKIISLLTKIVDI